MSFKMIFIESFFHLKERFRSLVINNFSGSILLISHRFLQGKVIYGVTVILFSGTVFMALFQYTGHWGISANAIFMFLAGACNCGVDPYLTGSIPAEIGEHENAQAATSGLVNGKHTILHV